MHGNSRSKFLHLIPGPHISDISVEIETDNEVEICLSVTLVTKPMPGTTC